MAAPNTMIGSSKAMAVVENLIVKVAPNKAGVLIVGESGTGKELVARRIHDLSPLKAKPFVPVNCGAIPENLIESELFGHRRGSFTGAVNDKQGLFEVASGGTIFLDEVGELPLSMQVKLLRVLQDRTIRRVGGTEDSKVDARVIAATNRDLEKMVAKGTFREDLFYRLNVIQIRTPPLRERREDIPILIEHFLTKLSKKLGLPDTNPVLAQNARTALESYEWPGNVRELENSIERALAMSGGTTVLLEHLPVTLRDHGQTTIPGIKPTLPEADFSHGPIGLSEILKQVESYYRQCALRAAGGDEQKAKKLLE